jgi:predicted branched-subunit amino acid permease
MCLGLPSGLFPSGFLTKILYASYLFGPNILLSTQFLNIRHLRSSLNFRDQVSHTYKAIRKIIVLYILIFAFLGSRREDKSCDWMVASNARIQSPLNSLPNIRTMPYFQNIC